MIKRSCLGSALRCVAIISSCGVLCSSCATFPAPEGHLVKGAPSLLFPHQRIMFLGGDGSVPSEAVIIKGSESTVRGLHAEDAWLENKYGTSGPFFMVRDRIDFQGRKLHEVKMCGETNYFDITEFYDKDVLGRWHFAGNRGQVLSGTITAAERSQLDMPHGWVPRLDDNDGVLTFQVEESVESYLWIRAEVRGGMIDGDVWHWVFGEGWGLSEFRYGRPHGWSQRWYLNGAIWSRIRWKHGKPHGTYTIWRRDGTLKSMRHYRDGILHGTVTIYYDNGRKGKETPYSSGKISGNVVCWHRNGKKKSETTFRDGEEQHPSRHWDEHGLQMKEMERVSQP